MCPIASPPFSPVEPVVDVLHGVCISDPYRWLEDQNAPRTRAWIEEQTRYARTYLDSIPGRDDIRKRVRQLLNVESHDSFLKSGKRTFFRKRLPGQEQPCIYFREGIGGEDQLLIDPAARGTGTHTAVKPLRVSADGSLLLYELKQGGERMGVFQILDITNRRVLPDALPHGYLRGFAFAPDGKSFYYVHEASQSQRPFYRAAFHHVLGTDFTGDKEIFRAGEGQKLRLNFICSVSAIGFLVYRFFDKICTDFYLWRMGSTAPPIPILRDAEYTFAPRLVPGRILAVVDQDAPNRRIVEVQPRKKQNPLYFDLIPEADAPIRDWTVTANHVLVSYVRGACTEITVFDRFGKRMREIPCDDGETVRITAASLDDDEILLERESFTRPIEIAHCSAPRCEISAWAKRSVPFDPAGYAFIKVSFPSKDGISVPVFLVGRRDVLAGGTHPVIMTSYGGFGVSMTPQFSVLVSFLLERGCLFALPNIRGGLEFGAKWHEAAKRRNRQTAFDDFLSAAEWLIETGQTIPQKLAIFGGSNSGLLVAAAMAQRPDLFGAVLCMVPLTDMLRYHLFDSAHVWKDEFGTADDPDDFQALFAYSPYHRVRQNTAYPATMIVSGGVDQNCNPLHARKLTARLQAASSSDHPILLDYNGLRGHAPVLPLGVRIAALTDRLAFLCDQLRVFV
jgi:prolyl oligopeptidase